MKRLDAPGLPRVRVMEARDVARVVEIESEAFTSPWRADTFLSLLDRPGAELWVLEMGGEAPPDPEIVGYAVVWCVLDQAEIANIAVAPGHRGSGLGAALLEHMLEVARGRGAETVYLEVRVSNQAARRLYRRFGFEEAGVRRDYYDHPREDALVLRRKL
ncbi:MAG: ribosomal protein S18-alanine N-acetyltransferase [Gemmatimonadota bacterium]